MNLFDARRYAAFSTVTPTVPHLYFDSPVDLRLGLVEFERTGDRCCAHATADPTAIGKCASPPRWLLNLLRRRVSLSTPYVVLASRPGRRADSSPLGDFMRQLAAVVAAATESFTALATTPAYA